MSVFNAATLAYFAAHGIDSSVAERAGVTERDGQLVYPYADGEGQYERVRSLKGDAKTRQPAGRPLCCWMPAGRPERGETVLVCEGESDALAALSVVGAGASHAVAAGILAGLRVVAVPGASYPVDRLVCELRSAGTAVLAPDGDRAGDQFAERAGDALLSAGIPTARLSLSGGRDLADYLVDAANGSDWLASAIADADLTTAREEPAQAVTTGRREDGPIRFLDVAAMVSAPPPPVAWLAPPILPRASLTALFAPGGDGKSLLAAALACAIARGGEVAGIACETGRTVYLDGENGEWEIHRRVHTLDMPTEGVQVADASGFDLRSDLGLLAEVIVEHRPDLVVLDSFRSLTPGLDENDTKQTAGVLDPLRRLFHESGVAGLLIHHTNKAGKDYRGASSIRDACDVLWHLGRHDDDQDSRRRFLACRKMRVAAEPERLWLRLEVDRGRVLIDQAESPVAEQRVTQPVRKLLSNEILASMNGKPEKLAAIAEMVGRGPKDGSVRNALSALLRDGLVERSGNDYLKVQTVQTDTLHLAPDEVQSANALKGSAPLHPSSDGDPAGELERLTGKFGDISSRGHGEPCDLLRRGKSVAP